jgi:hypothetical protein
MELPLVPGQISAGDTLDCGTGMRPVTPASRAMFVPLQIVEVRSVDTAIAPQPTGHVSVQYMSPMGQRLVHIPWRAGMTASDLFKAARRKEILFRSVSVMSWARVVGNQRVRLNYLLHPGDVLKLNPPNKPYV